MFATWILAIIQVILSCWNFPPAFRQSNLRKHVENSDANSNELAKNKNKLIFLYVPLEFSNTFMAISFILATLCLMTW